MAIVVAGNVLCYDIISFHIINFDRAKIIRNWSTKACLNNGIRQYRVHLKIEVASRWINMVWGYGGKAKSKGEFQVTPKLATKLPVDFT